MQTSVPSRIMSIMANPLDADPADTSTEGSVDSLVDQLLALINGGELSPGQRVDQRTVAARLQVSRTPLREALKALQADGIMTHETNRGYTVTKLSAADLLQYHHLRNFIESDLIASINWPDDEALAKLKRLNQSFTDSGHAGDVALMALANREFHFLVFSWSDKRILFQELKRIWRITDAYQITFFSTPERRRGVIKEHDAIVRAIEAKDMRRLKQVSQTHSKHAADLLEDLRNSQVSMPQLLVSR